MQTREPLIAELARLQDTAKQIQTRATELRLGLPAYIATVLQASLQELLEEERERMSDLGDWQAGPAPTSSQRRTSQARS